MKKLSFICVCVILIVLFTCFLVSACSRDNQSDKSDPNINAPADDAKDGGDGDEAEMKVNILDVLPQNDYKGKEIRILNSSGGPGSQYWLHLEICADTETGEPLNDAIYARNKKVEDHFNVQIKEIEGKSAWEARGTAEKTIKAGSEDFELFLTDTNESCTVATQGLTVDFNTLPIVDLKAPYWDQDMIRDLSVNNKIYFLAGDFLLTHYDATHILMVNKKMLAELGLEDPYALVKNNNWTFDKFYELGKSAAKDLNGDGVMDQNDRLGYASWHHMTLPSFMVAAGQWSVSKDSTDKPVVNINTPDYVNVYHKYMEMVSDPMFFYDGSKMKPRDDFICETMFRNEQTLFFTEIVYYGIALRDLDLDFGFLPHPKFNANSNISKSYVINPNTINIPITNSDLECASIILEALNSISRDTVIPAYYEITLKMKASRDEQSSEVIDLIFNNRSYDMGFNTYGNVLGFPFITIAEKSDNNITSFYEKNAPKIEAAMQKTIDFYFGDNN